jgi:xanthine dehydrogenase accessory factor
MSDSSEILDRAAAWADAGEDVAIATVVQTWGSSPRPAGSRLILTRSGRMEGSVSGGCIEGAVAAAAGEILDGAPRTNRPGRSASPAAAG